MKKIDTTRSAMRSGIALASLALALALPAVAHAQDADDGDSKDDKEIIVTGTLIRGKVPVGSNAIALSAEKIQASAPISSNELLASIPQVSNYFNKVPIADLAIAINQIQISRPNLRNISPNNAASSATLIMVDGHRVATAGVNQASVDPDLIVPGGAVARVEVVTEGGSATYGTDAVAGVINFITRRRFDGIEVGGHYGFADNYYQWDAKATIGKDWGSGSLWVSYNYAKSDFLFGRERDYIRNVSYAAEPYVARDLDCPNSNLVNYTIINGDTTRRNVTSYAAPGFVKNTSNLCDNSENSSIIPQVERHNVMVGLSQDLDNRTSIDMRAYYSQRNTLQLSDLTGSVALGASNPAAAALPTGLVVGATTLFGFPATAGADVSFSLRPLLGDGAAHKTVSIKQWGFNAEVKHDLNDNWQVRALLNYGASDTFSQLQQISQARLNAAGSPGAPYSATNRAPVTVAFNPVNVMLNDAALVRDLIDSAIAGQTRDQMLEARLIAEGKLFDISGGEVRLALGYEHMSDTLQKRFSSDVRLGQLKGLPFTPYTRHVDSFFGELQMPLISDGNGGSMLTLSAAGRYDHYSDFGGTFNPKFGATFKPVSWFTLRGNWGKSFTAPTPLDQLGSLSNFTSFNANLVPFPKPGETAPSGAGTVAIQGSVPGLRPQTATTWSIGADITPIDGLRFSASYYDVHFANILRTPFSFSIFRDFPNNVQTKLTGFTPAEVAAFLGNTPGAATTITSVGSSLVYEMVDFRTANFGILDVTGLDFSANYRMQTGFGGVDLEVSANRPLTRVSKISSTAPVVDELALDNPKLILQAAVGADIGKFRAQATVNYSAGYNITPLASVPVQSTVGSYTTVNLFFKYDVPGDGMFKDLSFTLNVNNLLDTDPPILRGNSNNQFGFANGFTIGRMFNFGINKKF